MYKLLVVFAVAAGAFFSAKKSLFDFFENPLIFYKLLVVFAVAAGAFFSSKKSLFDFRDGSGVHLSQGRGPVKGGGWGGAERVRVLSRH